MALSEAESVLGRKTLGDNSQRGGNNLAYLQRKLTHPGGGQRQTGVRREGG